MQLQEPSPKLSGLKQGHLAPSTPPPHPCCRRAQLQLESCQLLWQKQRERVNCTMALNASAQKRRHLFVHVSRPKQDVWPNPSSGRWEIKHHHVPWRELGLFGGQRWWRPQVSFLNRVERGECQTSEGSDPRVFQPQRWSDRKSINLFRISSTQVRDDTEHKRRETWERNHSRTPLYPSTVKGGDPPDSLVSKAQPWGAHAGPHGQPWLEMPWTTAQEEIRLPLTLLLSSPLELQHHIIVPHKGMHWRVQVKDVPQEKTIFPPQLGNHHSHQSIAERLRQEREKKVIIPGRLRWILNYPSWDAFLTKINYTMGGSQPLGGDFFPIP